MRKAGHGLAQLSNCRSCDLSLCTSDLTVRLDADWKAWRIWEHSPGPTRSIVMSSWPSLIGPSPNAGRSSQKLAFQSATQDADTQAADLTHSERAIATIKTGSDVTVSGESQFEAQRNTDPSPDGQPAREPAQALIACVRDILSDLLASPKAEAEVAVALQVS